MPKGKYRLPLFIRWLSLEFFSSHCRPQATSGSYRLNVVCIIRVFFKLHVPTHCYTNTYECVYMCEWVCVRANKVHCLTVYNRLSEMGIKRGLHAFKVCRGLHMLLLLVRFRQSSYGERNLWKDMSEQEKYGPFKEILIRELRTTVGIILDLKVAELLLGILHMYNNLDDIRSNSILQKS